MIFAQRQRPRVACQRLLMTAEILQRSSAVADGVGVIGLERECAIVARQRLDRALELAQDIAPIVEDLGVVRVDLEHAIETGEGVGLAADPAQHHAAIGERPGRARPLQEGALDQLERFGAATLLVTRHAEQVQGVEMTGRRLQEPQVIGLGLRPLSALMQVDRSRQQVGENAAVPGGRRLRRGHAGSSRRRERARARVRCSWTRRTRHWSWCCAACRAGSRSHPWCPSG